MGNRAAGTVVKIVTTVTFLGMVAVNALANILPINGMNTGQVSDAYPNLFAPAGLTFAIWGLIYLLLAGYTLYQLGLFQGYANAVKTELLQMVGIIFSISSLANAAWIYAWHYDLIPLSMLLMIVILVCLIAINLIVNKETLSLREKLFIRLPFSVYFGWITVAAIANMTVLLVSRGWGGFGIAEAVWAVIIMIVGMLIGAATTIKNRDAAYGLVLVWAYSGILIKHTSADGFAGQYSAIIITVIVCIVLLLAAAAYSFFAKRQWGRS
jgi:hypothetical protein